MALVPCDWIYKMLGDNCNNRCNNCFGDKDVRICKRDFEVPGEMLEKITIKKGSWWSLIFINNDHVLLDDLAGQQLTLKRDLFDSYFESCIYGAVKDKEEDIYSLPSVQPKIKTGHWIDHPQGEQCSECGLYVIGRHNDNYCPYCASYNRSKVTK